MFTTAIEVAAIVSSFLIQRLRYRRALPTEFKPRRILVVKLDHLGDVLLATPVFSNLRRAYPQAQIHALVGDQGTLVLQKHPDVDKIIEYSARFFCRSGEPTRLHDAFQLFYKLSLQKYDLLIDLRGDWLTVIFALFKGAGYRLDFASLQVANKLGRSRFTGSHEVERNLDVLRSAHIPTPFKAPTFHTTLADQRWVDDFLIGLGWDTDRPLVAIHPGSPIELKRWRGERFAALADWLIKHNGAVILFVGVKAESPLVARIQKQMCGKAMNITGKTNLARLAEILKRCDLFIGNDSGPMHLAAAVGTPTIGLYGPGNPERFGPVGAHCRTVRRMPDCPPCLGTTCKFGGEGCTKEIEVGDVIQIVGEHMAGCVSNSA